MARCACGRMSTKIAPRWKASVSWKTYIRSICARASSSIWSMVIWCPLGQVGQLGTGATKSPVIRHFVEGHCRQRRRVSVNTQSRCIRADFDRSTRNIRRTHDIVNPAERERSLIAGVELAFHQGVTGPTEFGQRTTEDGQCAERTCVVVQFGVAFGYPADEPHIDVVVRMQASGPTIERREGVGNEVVETAVEHAVRSLVGQSQQIGRAKAGRQRRTTRTASGRPTISATTCGNSTVSSESRGQNREICRICG